MEKIVTSTSGITPIDGKIYWHVNEDRLTEDMDKYKILFAFEQSFKIWQEYMNPVFTPTNDRSKAAIVINFRHNGDSDLPEPFSDTTLAYAFFPGGTSLGIHSDMYFNDNYNWQEMHTATSINLFKVAVHELGHSLGLHHSATVERDIMDPIYTGDDQVILTDDTIQGIYALYGVKKIDSPGTENNILRGISKTELNKFRESSIVKILTNLGIPATTKDLKRDSVEKLYNAANKV